MILDRENDASRGGCDTGRGASLSLKLILAPQHSLFLIL
jgi:hypothetical protein